MINLLLCDFKDKEKVSRKVEVAPTHAWSLSFLAIIWCSIRYIFGSLFWIIWKLVFHIVYTHADSDTRSLGTEIFSDIITTIKVIKFYIVFSGFLFKIYSIVIICSWMKHTLGIERPQQAYFSLRDSDIFCNRVYLAHCCVENESLNTRNVY